MIDYVDPVLNAPALFTKRLAEFAALQEKTKASERKRLWIAAVKSVKRSTTMRNRVSKTSK